MQQSPQLPNTNRQPQVEYTSLYHLINCYIISLVKNQSIADENEKYERLKEMGIKLGSNVMESIAAMAFDKIKMNPDLAQGKYTEYVRFLGKDFWMYMFGQSVSKVQMNQKGTVYEIEDRYDEQKKQGSNSVSIKPGFQWTRRISLNDEKLLEQYLELFSKLVQGIIMGAMKNLGVECEVEVKFLNNSGSDLHFNLSILDPLLIHQGEQSRGDSMNTRESFASQKM